MVTVTFNAGTDLQVARSDVEKAVSTVDDLPEDSETPVVREMEFTLPVVSVALLHATTDRRAVERVEDILRDVPGVSSVQVSGLADRILAVDLDPSRMSSLSITPDQVVAAIRQARASVPAGSVEPEGAEILVKTDERLTGAEDVAQIPLGPTGSLRIGDVATVRDTFDDLDTEFYVNGAPAVKLTLNREDGADPVGIRGQVFEMLPELARQVPAHVSILVADDYTTPIRDRLEVVGINAISGAILVILVLYVMSGPRQALLAVWGMPVSYLLATFLMARMDMSLNVISSFGLLIATGIIVDDAIVVIENVQRHMEMGKSRMQATLDGAREVLLPVTVAVTTTMFAFMPLTMVGGAIGRVMKYLPLVVIFCLLGSLLEAIFILPGHLHEFASSDQADSRPARLARRMQAVYRPIVGWTVRHRYLTILLTVLAFAGAVFTASRMHKQIGAPGKPFELQLFYELPPGTGKDATRAEGERMIDLVRQDLPEGSIIATTLRVGTTNDRRTGKENVGGNHASIRWEFELSDGLRAAYPPMVRHLRTYLATHPRLGSTSLAEVQAGPPAGAAITARIRGREPDQVNAAVFELEQELRGWPGVTDIRDDYGSGQETFRIRVDPDRAKLYGLTQLQVAQAARTAIDGAVAEELSLDEDPVEVLVRYADARDLTREQLGDLLIASQDPRTGAGTYVRLDQIAHIERTREVSTIRREDGQRTVSVLGDVDGERETAISAAAKIRELWDTRFRSRYPELTLAFGGEADEFSQSLSDLPAAFALAVTLIYVALALQFRSYSQPFIILAAVPFGVTGAVYGLVSMGFPLSLFAMFGVVALAGISVNDSLVMVEFINKLRDSGVPVRQAAIDGAVHRLRPIVSTTLTTVLGLLPLAVGLGGQDLILAPMAVVISAGLGVATSLILLAIPPIYLVFEEARGLLRRRPRPTADGATRASETPEDLPGDP